MKHSVCWLITVLALMTLSCKTHDERYDHSDEHPEGHDHHEEGHGHGDRAMIRKTVWSPHFELFAEHAPLVVGEETALLMHVTIVDGYRPLNQARLALQLEPADAMVSSPTIQRQPGIFHVTLEPQRAGLVRARLAIDGELSGTIDGIEFSIFESDEAATVVHASEEDSGLIELLKEQQWGVPFGTAFAKEGSLTASIQVAGTVETPPGGSAEVGAPIQGRLIAPKEGLPYPGETVKEGQQLASLLPAPGSPEDAARASLAVAEAEARASRAQAALARSERLIEDQAISQRELEDAQREMKVAEEAVRSARRAAQLFLGASSGGGSGSWQLKAPISGVLTHVHATPGKTVGPGEVLFRIVDESELWIRARIPEQDAARLRDDRDASYRVSGLDAWETIDISGDDANAKVVTVGKTVDPVSRTVDVLYSLNTPSRALRVGGLVEVNLPTGEDTSGVILPRGALVDEEGREVVYVQVDGEHFVERSVTSGARAGNLVAVVHGLSPGERVVVRGAHFVRLADKSNSGQAHGHIH